MVGIVVKPPPLHLWLVQSDFPLSWNMAYMIWLQNKNALRPEVENILKHGKVFCGVPISALWTILAWKGVPLQGCVTGRLFVTHQASLKKWPKKPSRNQMHSYFYLTLYSYHKLLLEEFIKLLLLFHLQVDKKRKKSDLSDVWTWDLQIGVPSTIWPWPWRLCYNFF